MLISIVAAMGPNGVIGKDGEMPWRLPSDLARFKKITEGGTVIMGYKTLVSIGRALPERENIVLTRQHADEVRARGGIAAPNPQQALATARSPNRIFVIGGAEIYKLFLPMARVAYLTCVHGKFEGDTFFPETGLRTREWKPAKLEGFPPSYIGRQWPEDSHDSEFYTSVRK